ncbi:MAG TPA: hypothetical protein VIV61_01055 [Candidatus Ozemobacteraceae bacterium]
MNSDRPGIRRPARVCVALLFLATGRLAWAGPDIPATGANPLPLIAEPAVLTASAPAHGGAVMPGRIIRLIPMSHCKRGPQACEKCRAMGGPRICLLNIDLTDPGMVQRRVIELTIEGKRVWREFEIIRTFADEAEARTWAAAHGITDIDLTK